MRISVCIGVLLIVALVNPREAAGQTSVPRLDCQDDAACNQLKERAAERSKSGDLPEALRLYKQAYEVRADPRLLYNIARTLHKQGQRAEAASYYQSFLDSPVNDEEPREKAREYLKEILSPSPSASAAPPPRLAKPALASVVAPTEMVHTNVAPIRRSEDQRYLDAGTQEKVEHREKARIQLLESKRLAEFGQRQQRPRWPLITGVGMLGVGALLLGFGVSAFVPNGGCSDDPIVPGRECRHLFATDAVGGALTGTGGALLLGGTVLLVVSRRSLLRSTAASGSE